MSIYGRLRLHSELACRLLRPAVERRFCGSCEKRFIHTTPSRRAGPSLREALPRASRGNDNNGSKTWNARVLPLTVLTGGGVVGALLAVTLQHDEIEQDEEQSPRPATAAQDDRDPSLPRFRISDIRKHDANSPAPWVTHEDKVYDITDWIEAHPGGEVILRAAGSSIDPYWNIFTIHKAAHVYEILAQYLIGYIDAADLVDGRPAAEAIEDPFESDPVRDKRLITHTAKPRNAEPPNEVLDRDFVTPSELFYVRNHMWVPTVEEGENAAQHTLTVELLDGETRTYTVEELRRRFQAHKVTVTMQCSGNRRNDMTLHAGKTNGLQWGVGAISNAEWEGVLLADVLADAGFPVQQALSPSSPPRKAGGDDAEVPDPRELHVQFAGLEAYGASIPLPTALDPRGDVLIAFAMNGQPLPRDHGFPLRAVVPGHVAARSVKWLSKITIADEESTSQWQRRDYKCFGPNEGANPDWDRAPAIQEMPVTSAITGVWVGDAVVNAPWLAAKKDELHREEQGEGEGQLSKTVKPVALQGYAYSGGGREISRVDISLNNGQTWDQAELVDDCGPDGKGCSGSKHWAWKRWRYAGRLPELASRPDDGESSRGAGDGCTTLVVKATDTAYNSQPESHAGIYNVRGNLATAWHRVRLCANCKTDAADPKGTAAKTYGCGFGKESEAAAAQGGAVRAAVNEKKNA